MSNFIDTGFPLGFQSSASVFIYVPFGNSGTGWSWKISYIFFVVGIGH